MTTTRDYCNRVTNAHHQRSGRREEVSLCTRSGVSDTIAQGMLFTLNMETPLPCTIFMKYLRSKCTCVHENIYNLPREIRAGTRTPEWSRVKTCNSRKHWNAFARHNLEENTQLSTPARVYCAISTPMYDVLNGEYPSESCQHGIFRTIFATLFLTPSERAVSVVSSSCRIFLRDSCERNTSLQAFEHIVRNQTRTDNQKTLISIVS